MSRFLLPLLATLLVSAVPASAQDRFEVSLRHSRLPHSDYAYNGALLNGGSGSDLPCTITTSAKGGVGLAASYRLTQAFGASIRVLAQYQPRVSMTWCDAENEKPSTPSESRYDHVGDYKVASKALGLRATWTHAVELGVEALFQADAIELSTSWREAQSVTVTRPWVGASIGYVFPRMGRVAPFLRAGFALPVTRPSAPDRNYIRSHGNQSSDDYRRDVIRYMAPKSTTSFEAGIRF